MLNWPIIKSQNIYFLLLISYYSCIIVFTNKGNIDNFPGDSNRHKPLGGKATKGQC